MWGNDVILCDGTIYGPRANGIMCLNQNSLKC